MWRLLLQTLRRREKRTEDLSVGNAARILAL
jgi:hypothetical protein